MSASRKSYLPARKLAQAKKLKELKSQQAAGMDIDLIPEEDEDSVEEVSSDELNESFDSDENDDVPMLVQAPIGQNNSGLQQLLDMPNQFQ